MRHIKFFHATAGLLSCWLGATVLQAANLDLRSYYAFLLQDGFTATYVGNVDGPDGRREGQWTYRTVVEGADGGGTLTGQNIVVAIAGTQTSITTNYRVTTDGVHYLGGKTVTGGMGFSIEIITEVDGDSLFMPRRTNMPGMIEWEADYVTRMAAIIPGLPPTEVRDRLQGTTRFLGFETVTVPAGTFYCLKTESEETDAEGTTVSTGWYAREIGLVKAINEEREENGISVFNFELSEVVGYTPFTPLTKLLSNAEFRDAGFFLNWLGFFSELEESEWIFHYGLGFMFPAVIFESGGGWFYSPRGDLGFIFFAPGTTASQPNGTLTGWAYSTGIAGGSWVYFILDYASGALFVSVNGTGGWIEIGR